MKGQCLAGGLEVSQAAEVERLEARVMGRLSGRVRDLRLLARSNGLILQGHAHTYYVKQLAQHAVMETTRLPILANEIEVCECWRINHEEPP